MSNVSRSKCENQVKGDRIDLKNKITLKTWRSTTQYTYLIHPFKKASLREALLLSTGICRDKEGQCLARDAQSNGTNRKHTRCCPTGSSSRQRLGPAKVSQKSNTWVVSGRRSSFSLGQERRNYTPQKPQQTQKHENDRETDTWWPWGLERSWHHGEYVGSYKSSLHTLLPSILCVQ